VIYLIPNPIFGDSFNVTVGGAAGGGVSFSGVSREISGQEIDPFPDTIQGSATSTTMVFQLTDAFGPVGHYTGTRGP
jgi:hypothetical protein